ncbi:MAG: hypothetical protein JNM31_00125 [Flavobacteriales bacterium]|nr:hypothetical protein [Flavobacteriales bacterium]
MNKDQLLGWMAERGDPCITIQFTVDANDREGTRIRLKNLLRAARLRLEQDHGNGVPERLGARLDALAAQADLERGPGKVMLVSEGIAEVVDLPFPVREEVVLERNFRTRQLVRAMTQPATGHVLLLSGAEARLSSVAQGTLTPALPPFPLVNDIFPRDRLEASTITAEVQLREFFNRVDKHVQAALGPSAPIVLACVKEHEAQYRTVCDRPERIWGCVHGDHMRTPSHALASAVLSVMQKAQQQHDRAVLTELQRSPVDRYISDPHVAWRTVREGRGRHLLIEEDLHIPVTLAVDAEMGMDQLPVTNDLVDELIEEQMRHMGSVHFLPKGDLAAYGGIALLTRY